MQDTNAFLTRYMAMWHEPDAARRREIVAALFAADGECYTGKSASRGIDEVAARVTRSHDQWVAQKGYRFQPAGNTDRHHHVLKFFWHMLPKGGGKVEAMGLDLFVFDADGRVRTLYQFNEPTPA